MRPRGFSPHLTLFRILVDARLAAVLPALAAVSSVRLYPWRTDPCSIHVEYRAHAACTSASSPPGRFLSARPAHLRSMPKCGVARIAVCCRMSISPAPYRTTAGRRWCAACSVCFARVAGTGLPTWPVRNLLMGLSEIGMRHPILRSGGKVLRQTHPNPAEAGMRVHWLRRPDAGTAFDKRKCRPHV